MTRSKGKTALKKTGRALKGAARGALSAGAEILGAGAAALNPVRRKIRNKYIDLVIKGQAKKTPDGWRIGKKTFAQGRGTVSVSSGYYLDKATGLVYAKRERNTAKKAGKRNASRTVHPARKTKTGRAGASRKTVHKTKALRSVAARRKVATKRITRNPSAESIRKEFAGSVSGSRDLFFPQGTPQGLAKLGKLVSITTEEGTIKPVHGSAWLCADTKERLHIGSTTNAPLFSGPARSLGKVSKIEYESSKPHLGYRGPIIWFHKVGEENGVKPTLHADGKGGLVFKGGQYRLTRRGIEN